MRYEHAPHLPACKLRAEHFFPVAPASFGIHAGIDDRPSFAVFEQPQVDMADLERQRHAQPTHAWQDFNGLPGFRHSLEFVVKLEK